MAENWVKKPVEWTIKDVGAPLLDSLAGGLYSKLEVFREYVQNAVDSYVDFEQKVGRAPQNTVQVWVDSENRALHIKDDGIGMDWEDIKTAKAIAVSPKLVRFNEFVGFRGLGIWSGLSACEKLILTTTKIGVPNRYRLIIDCKGIVDHYQDPIPIDELLKDRLEIHESLCDAEDHFTQVKLDKIYTDRFRELLDVKALTRYSERNLPVSFDPAWKSTEIVDGTSTTKRSFSEIVQDALKDVPWSANYMLTINGAQVYRRFQAVSEIKLPERHVIADSAGLPVAVAWLCETNRRGSKKVLEMNSDKGWVRNFAIRVKNFTIGERGLYTDQNVMDAGYLDWFVGEIYITDESIKPDTKRTQFQPSPRYDVVVEALRRFYTSVALRARGWSAQVNVEEDYEQVKYKVKVVESILDNSVLTYKQKRVQLDPLLKDLEKLWSGLHQVREEANKIDSSQDAERTSILKTYLRKPEVKQAINLALNMLDSINDRLSRFVPENISTELNGPVLPPDPPTLVLNKTKSSTNGNGKSGRSKARTNRLKGQDVGTNDVLNTHVVAGVLPGLEDFLGVGETKNESKKSSAELSIAIEAFRAAIAVVVGEGTEVYHKIVDQIPEELHRRGIHV